MRPFGFCASDLSSGTMSAQIWRLAADTAEATERATAAAIVATDLPAVRW